MIKGVNKKIIEISRTGDDAFERVILFLNPEHTALNSRDIYRRADSYVNGLDLNGKKKTKFKLNYVVLGFASLLSMIAGMALGILLIVLLN